MIHVDRNKVHTPQVLGPDPKSPGKRELKEAEKFFSTPLNKRRQKRFLFKAYNSNEVRTSLSKLFYNKCSYCEVKFGPIDIGNIVHYRPISGVITDKEYYPDLYWWLANEWNNLHISCVNCGRALIHEGIEIGKGNRFPLKNESKRASRSQDVKFEAPLLLDPCIDHPEEHLIFLENGRVISETKRGEITIQLFNLNRTALIEKRKKVATQIHEKINLMKSTNEKMVNGPTEIDKSKTIEVLITEIINYTKANQEFAGLKRQLINTELSKMLRENPELELPISKTNIEKHIISGKKIHRVQKSYQSFQRSQETYSLHKIDGKKKYRYQRIVIEWIKLKNVKAIRNLYLRVDSTQSGGTPWFMLIGENATGKSTVLQSIAFVLLGAKYFNELITTREVDPSTFIRNRCKHAYIDVKLSGFLKPHKLIIHETYVEFKNPRGEKTIINFKKSKVIVGNSWDPQTLLLGYGSTRLLPRTYQEKSYGGDFARVDNLFDPFIPLLNVKKWLLKITDADYDYIIRALKILLNLNSENDVIRDDIEIYIKTFSNKVTLDELSDGYQSVVALIIDILEVVLRLWPTPEDAHGIVLLDEIGAHLHPTWKMNIVTSLRKTLPNIQFITTTHQPLCLRGLARGEVVVMKRDEQSNIIAITDLPSPNDFRVDQLLTSEFFGLNSTIDPEIESLFNQYYTLLAKNEHTIEEKEKLSGFKMQLKDRRHLGNTQREELMYEAIDKYLADRRFKQPLPNMDKIRSEVILEISNIWKDIIKNNG